MGTFVCVPVNKKWLVFLNISFVVVATAISVAYFTSPKVVVVSSSNSVFNNQNSCQSLQEFDDFKAKCFYLQSHDPCFTDGYIDYLNLFYCNFGRFPLLGHCLLFLWLLVLFYLLGDTASEYFCSSLESLSKLLNLSPTIAGVTLLSLGNGAPDVFSSLVSFMGDETDEVGFNTVLGGVSFVTCVVVGVISICVSRKHVKVNRYAFVRDVCFLLMVLVCLIVMVVWGRIDIWCAIGLLCMYVVYVVIVIHHSNNVIDENDDLSVPILDGLEKGGSNCLDEQQSQESEEANKLSVIVRTSASPPTPPPKTCCEVILYIIQLPLDLPRRLTIPVVCEKRWSKPVAVISVTLAPVFLSVLWNPENGISNTSLVVYGIGLATGISLGIVTCLATEASSPPKRCALLWLIAGFIMSVVWTYITAQELVALLVSLGYIFEINPSILGLTVLAWGNSLGDLITNLTLTLNGGAHGAQVALSGCYAGPIFNILFGFGSSLIGSFWKDNQSSTTIPKDTNLLETLAFLVAGLLWALLVLPKRGMRLDGVLGGGLLVIYIVFMSLELIQTLQSLRSPSST